MPASEDLLTALKAFYAETLRPDVEGIVKSSERRVRKQLRREMRQVEGRLRFETREGDERARETLQASLDELRRDMNGHFDTVHKRLGHLEIEYRMLSVGLRRREHAQESGTSG